MVAFTVAILAGGKSSRMGRDKAFVELNGKLMIEHVIERTQAIGQAETILITNRPEDYARFGLPIFADVLPDKGSLGGIYTAIHYSTQAYTLCVACDMPFIQPDLLKHMVSLAQDWDVVVPLVDEYPEGLHALYSRKCLDAIHPRLLAGQLKVVGFYADVRVRYLKEAEYASLDPDATSFQNINTPDDLADVSHQ